MELFRKFLGKDDRTKSCPCTNELLPSSSKAIATNVSRLVSQSSEPLNTVQSTSPTSPQFLNNMLNSQSKKNSVFAADVWRWEPNDYHRKLLRRTWSDEFEFLYELGTTIYAYIFEKSPDAKTLFPVLANAGSEWRETKVFGQQALRFVQVLSHSIKNMYHTDRLDPILYKVGQAHCKYASRGFRPEHWVVFREAIQVTLTEHIMKRNDLNEQEKVDAVQQWEILALYIVQKMYQGFCEGISSKNSTSEPDDDDSDHFDTSPSSS